MTFTFVPANDIGTVRRLTGDTIENEAELTDEEIQAWLDEAGNDHVTASVKILRSLANRWAKRATITTGNEKLESGKVSESYRLAADALEQSLGTQRVLSNKNVSRIGEAYRLPYSGRIRNYDYP